MKRRVWWCSAVIVLLLGGIGGLVYVTMTMLKPSGHTMRDEPTGAAPTRAKASGPEGVVRRWMDCVESGDYTSGDAQFVPEVQRMMHTWGSQTGTYRQRLGFYRNKFNTVTWTVESAGPAAGRTAHVDVTFRRGPVTDAHFAELTTYVKQSREQVESRFERHAVWSVVLAQTDGGWWIRDISKEPPARSHEWW